MTDCVHLVEEEWCAVCRPREPETKLVELVRSDGVTVTLRAVLDPTTGTWMHDESAAGEPYTLDQARVLLELPPGELDSEARCAAKAEQRRLAQEWCRTRQGIEHKYARLHPEAYADPEGKRRRRARVVSA